MTDAELRKTLKKADALLAEYERIVMPAVEELARRHNAATGHMHEGWLGCYEEGIGTICLHIEESTKNVEEYDKCYESEDRLRERFFKGLEYVHLTTYF